MHIGNSCTLIGLGFAVLTAPVHADDCTTVKSAMLQSGHTPHSLTTTQTDGQGKKTVTRQVQTVDNKYVQRPDGKWYALNISLNDLNDDVSEVLSCRRTGNDSVNGESAAVYELQLQSEAQTSTQKLWVSPKNLILRSEGVIKGVRYSTEYDFARVSPPANALSLGGK